MSDGGEYPGSTLNNKLCDLMVRLKLENPELGRKGMLTAVHVEGAEWKDVNFDRVKRTWKKMMKKSSTDQQESVTSKSGKSKEYKKETCERQQPLSSPINSSKSPALEKQLNMLKDNTQANYVLFTPPNEPADCAIELSNVVGALFFNVMWNRVVEAPWESQKITRELWLIYQQLEANLNAKYKKLLRKQLQAEFGVDPFDGRENNIETTDIAPDELTKITNQL